MLHNSTLLDLTGCGQLMDWVADGHGCVVEMKRMMKRTTEFNQALSILYRFVEGDAQGKSSESPTQGCCCFPKAVGAFVAQKWKDLRLTVTTSRTCTNERANHRPSLSGLCLNGQRQDDRAHR